jgi:metacaspase-1
VGKVINFTVFANTLAGGIVMAKHALCVGINDYPGTGSDLSGCVNDANDWAEVLATRGYQVATLLDGAAKRAGMVKALEALIDKGQSGDTLVFTFSGHGSWIPDENGDEDDARDEMLCPHDISKNQYLLDDDLAEIFGRKRSGVSLFFLSDSCHSGTVAKAFAKPLFPDAAKHPVPRFLPPEAFLKDKKALEKAVVIAAAGAKSTKQAYPALLLAGCRDTEFSYDAYFNGRANGAFTRVAIEVLKGKPKTPSAWHKAIRKHLPSNIHPQTPALFGSAKAKNGSVL